MFPDYGTGSPHFLPLDLIAMDTRQKSTTSPCSAHNVQHQDPQLDTRVDTHQDGSGFSHNTIRIQQMTPDPFATPPGQSSVSPNVGKRLNDLDFEEGRPLKRPGSHKTKSSVGRRQLLACPFFKKDPRRHWDCASWKDDTVSHVKQHIFRSHFMPYFCVQCGDEFKTLHLLHAHIRNDCSRSFEEPDSITMEQNTKLRSRFSAKLNVQAQWYAVFEILFPGTPRPISPFYSPLIEGTLEELQDFVVSNEGLDAVLICLLEGQSELKVPESEDRMRGALRRGLQSLIDRWAASRLTTGTTSLNGKAISPITPQSILPSRSQPVTRNPGIHTTFSDVSDHVQCDNRQDHANGLSQPGLTDITMHMPPLYGPLPYFGGTDFDGIPFDLHRSHQAFGGQHWPASAAPTTGPVDLCALIDPSEIYDEERLDWTLYPAKEASST